ncbi:MAG: polyprenyl synthetase family protein [Coriobacteriales bacterium]
MANIIFKQYLEDRAADIEAHLRTYFHEGTHPDMDRYLYRPLAAYSENGGKRHRPLITMLACKAVGGDEERVMRSGAAIEHFHTAALIHDDIADESQLRRGEPCMHITMGEGLAINAGDLALSLVTGTVLDDELLDNDVKIRVLKELVEMTTRTIEGQAMDIGWARDGRFDITVEDYLCMAQHKTAFYSGAVPLAIGAIVGGGTEEQIETLREYGMSTGLAFQLQDDLLNLVGGKEAATKDFRSDITEGKRTMIAVHALAHTEGAQHEELLTLLSTKETDSQRLERAVEIMREAGSIDYVRDYAVKLAHQGQGELKRVLPPSISRQLLISMGEFFVSRLS